MENTKRFIIGSKSTREFLSELTDEANAEALITELVSESSNIEDINNIFDYLESKQ